MTSLHIPPDMASECVEIILELSRVEVLPGKHVGLTEQGLMSVRELSDRIQRYWDAQERAGDQHIKQRGGE